MSAGIELLDTKTRYGYEVSARVLAQQKTDGQRLSAVQKLPIGDCGEFEMLAQGYPQTYSVSAGLTRFWFDLLSPPLTAIKLPVEGLRRPQPRKLMAQIDGQSAGARQTALTRIMPEQ